MYGQFKNTLTLRLIFTGNAGDKNTKVSVISISLPKYSDKPFIERTKLKRESKDITEKRGKIKELFYY